MKDASVKQYVLDAELPDSRDLAAFDTEIVTFDATRNQSVVVGPQVFSFVQGVTDKRRKAVANSALFASLVADAKVSRDDTKAWTDLYTDALAKLGWTLTEMTSREFDQKKINSQVHEAIIEVVEAFAIGGTALVLIKAALTALQSVSDKAKWFTLFDRQTRRENLCGFQVGLLDNKADGEFQVKLMGFSLQLSKSVTQFLILKFGEGAVHLDTQSNSFTIAEDILDDAMPDMVERLKKYVRSYVTEVALPPLP